MEIDDEQRVAALQDDWRRAGLSSRETALCVYAEKLTRTPWAMTSSDLESLKSEGLEDRAILDLCQVISYFNYINRIADGLGVDLEDFMPPAPGKP